MLEEDGGPAKSVVAEENGILLSMILRQYFMSIKVMRKWNNWTRQLGQHWGKVHERLHSVHPVTQPAKSIESSGRSDASTDMGAGDKVSASSWKGKTQRRESGPPSKKFKADFTHETYVDHSGSEGEDEDSFQASNGAEVSERKLFLMRKFMRRWWKLAGLPGHPNSCEEQNISVPWAKGITPRVEGRIKIVNGERMERDGRIAAGG